MSASLRFLGVAVLAWAGIRAATLDQIPGIELTGRALAEPVDGPPPIVPTEFPPIVPVDAYDPNATYAYAGTPHPPLPPGYAYAGAYHALPHYASRQVSAPPPRSASYPYAEPIAEPIFYAEIPTLDNWSLTPSASTAGSGRSSPGLLPVGPAVGPQSQAAAKLDRLQLSAWALLRGQPGPGGLASGGTLGGSQAGARLIYALDPRIAASLRTSSPIDSATRGGEVAAGVRLTPFASVPLALTAERRQAIGVGGGRSAFALFLEGGVYGRSLPWKLTLDGYAQAGVVGARSRDLFADGALTLNRHLHGPVSVGVGTWAGAQSGLYRIDAGPRLSMRVRKNMRIDLDWRQRLAGSAEPGSGPALTLSGQF